MHARTPRRAASGTRSSSEAEEAASTSPMKPAAIAHAMSPPRNAPASPARGWSALLVPGEQRQGAAAEPRHDGEQDRDDHERTPRPTMRHRAAFSPAVRSRCSSARPSSRIAIVATRIRGEAEEPARAFAAGQRVELPDRGGRPPAACRRSWAGWRTALSDDGAHVLHGEDDVRRRAGRDHVVERAGAALDRSAEGSRGDDGLARGDDDGPQPNRDRASRR